MPTSDLPPIATITVIFKGLLVTCIQEGEQLAEIGILGTSACHLPKLGITKTTADGHDHAIRLLSPLNLDEPISLKVDNTSLPGIRTFQADPFKRTDPHSNESDFRWFIDLDEIHQPPLDTTDKMKSIMKMNEGLFYTYFRSPGGLKLKRAGGQPEDFGFFALQIAANIYLDKDDSIATLSIGGKEFLTTKKADNERYTIVLDCECITPSNASDFPLIYEMVASDLPANEKVDFEGDPQLTGPGLTPEVYCSGVNLGKSKPK